MDIEILNQTLRSLSEDKNFARYSELFKKIDHFRIMNNRYMNIHLPISGIVIDEYEYARNIFSIKYNELYKLNRTNSLHQSSNN